MLAPCPAPPNLRLSPGVRKGREPAPACRPRIYRDEPAGDHPRASQDRYDLDAVGIPRDRGSGKSASAAFRAVYDRRLADAFLERFGDILIKLGYERDDS
jgi:hypothetical protein